uniref:Uncharacterized protein n=1 Tax=Oryza sativa subsp. japonica TaxID=39947 RepID=Q5VPU4_ORYSJ|nr:hypothetical protein [Oryza sativa Japonica Group]
MAVEMDRGGRESGGEEGDGEVEVAVERAAARRAVERSRWRWRGRRRGGRWRGRRRGGRWRGREGGGEGGGEEGGGEVEAAVGRAAEMAERAVVKRSRWRRIWIERERDEAAVERVSECEWVPDLDRSRRCPTLGQP